MQGRFKRDGSAAAEPEPRGATDRGTPAGEPAGPASAGRPKSKAKVKGKARTRKPGRKGGAGTPAPEQPGTAKVPHDPGSRIALRNWRISTRLISLLALPVVAATALGALRIQSNLENVDQLDHMKLLTDMTSSATRLANALQDERDRSAGPLVTGNDKDDRVVSSRQQTDQAIGDFRKATAEVKPNDEAMVGVTTTLVEITRQLDRIKDVRNSAYKNSDYYARTVNNYDALINSLLSLSQDMAQATSNSEMITSTRALASFSSAKEYASIQRAVITAALANTKGPALSPNDREYGQEALAGENEALARFTAIRGEDAKQLLQALNGGVPEITAAKNYADRALNRTDGLKADAKSYPDWYDQASIKVNEMAKVEQTLLNQMQQKARELRDEADQETWLNAALIVLVLGISLVGAFFVARSMVRSLRRLQDTAQKVAHDRLPELVQQLSESDPQDVDTSVESVGVHSRDEIGKVAAAFDEVHREAVRLAAEQALLRGNVNAMFTNLSRRSQGLIQRQLSLISELESREADPDQLSSLFKLDHLATRMRRNGENLLVLAGEEPGRRWTRPVPLVDVLRAAASEVEQYERIELSGVPPTEVAGRVVNDLVHLLAELLENATSFSSPQTKVKVTGHALPDGRVLVEIHDTGIGLSPDDLASINDRLASPPTVDVSVSRRMGLFVVGRLSLRHGIRVQLRPSDSGGTTALVMLPVDVAQGGKKPMPGAVPPAGGGSGMAGLMTAGQRRQVPPGADGGAPRPGLPGQGGTTRNGLPTRPAPSGGPGFDPAAGSLFDTSPRGGTDPGAAGPKGADGRAALPTRGAGAVPPPPAGDHTGRPERPAATDPAGLPTRPTPSWGAGAPSAAPVDDWPPASAGAARGHEDVDRPARGAKTPPNAADPAGLPSTTGEFRLPGGPGDTAQFPPVDATGAPADGGTGQFPLGKSTDSASGHGAPGDTAQFPRIPDTGVLPGTPDQLPAEPLSSTSGQHPQPSYGDPQNSTSGQHGLPGSGEPLSSTSGQYERPASGDPLGSTSGQYDLPAGGEPLGSTSGQHTLPGSGEPIGSTSGQHAQPHLGEPPNSTSGQHGLPAPGDPLGSTSGQYARPTAGEPLGGTSGQYAQPNPGEPPNSTSGQHGLPGSGDPLGSTSGQYDRPAPGESLGSTSGQHQQPTLGDPQSTGQYAQPPFGDPQSSTSGQYDLPAGGEPLGSTSGQHTLPGSGEPIGSTSGQHAQPHFGEPPNSTSGQHQQPTLGDPLGSASGQYGLSDGSAAPASARTPLFEELESNWFRGADEEDAAPAPKVEEAPRPPRREARNPLAQQDRSQDAPWRDSPNDERWRRAEQLREPAAGGLTSSGLPRRVPRANLVEGTAAQQQQTHPAGPQVSRAPDDVRGRLTNLRRGIQQGRQAGGASTTGSHHVGPTHQQER
ncbi:nitrate- and nitrite sensing domain-containing protein [Streptomyces gamaensis]|uniref:histidine kinase n=1 Tax=Streptomyces gamaensis TaxID=1763542 RepID=A0ABW0Z3N3_9ACTN